MNTTIRRSGLVAGLALLMSLALVLPVSAGSGDSPPPPLGYVVGIDLGSGPIKVSVTEPSATGDSESVTINFSIGGIPEPALLSPWQNDMGNWDFGRNETGIGLLGPDKAPLGLWDTYGLPIRGSYFGLRTVFVSPFYLPYLIVAGEKVSLEGPCDLTAIGTIVDWGDGSPKTTITSSSWCDLSQGEHIYKQAGDYRVKMSGNNQYDGSTWAQSFPITVVPSRSNLTAQLAPLLADLSSFDGSGAITGKLTLNRSGSTWIVQDLTMASPDGRVYAKPIDAGYVFDYRPLQDGETFYLSVLVQSVGEDCSVFYGLDSPAQAKDTKADANGYVPCGAYNVITPISVPAAPVASASPSVAPATPTPSASPVVSPTDQGGPINPLLLGLGALLFLSLMPFIAFRLRRRRDGDQKVV